MNNYNRRIINTTAIIFAFFLVTTTFGGVVFSDGSTSRTLPTVTLKKKTFKFFRKRYTRTWTMDTYVRITDTSYGTKVNGRTQVKSTFYLIGFTGGVFIDIKDNKGNLIYRTSAKNGQETTGYENGHDVGWGVNPRKSRVLSWEVIIPPDISLIGKTVDIYQIRTKKKVDWNKVKAKFSQIAKNLGEAIKNFFDSNGDEVILLTIKYGPQIIKMNDAAKAGTLQLSEVLMLMNNILVDAQDYGIISSSKAQNVVNIITAVNEIVINGKNGWAPKNQEMLVALVEDITVAIGNKSVTDATLIRIIDNFEDFLNDKSGLVGANLQPIEVILVNTKELIGDKLNAKQIELFTTVVDFISKINDYGQEPLLQQEKLNCIFAVARTIIDIRSKALAGTLTADYINEEMTSFLDVNYFVLGLSEAQNDAVQIIIDSIVNIINNSTSGLLPKNQEQIVSLILKVEQVATVKPLNYSLLNSLINELEELCNDKGEFAPSSLIDIEMILVNIQILAAPKLPENSKVNEIFTTAIIVVSTINNWEEVPVINNLSVIFNGMRLGVDLLEQAHNETITVEYAETQINSWYIELEPVLKEIYPSKTEQIDAIKSIIDNTFAIIKSGDEGWDFDHWTSVVDIFRAGMEIIQNKNQFENLIAIFKLKADFEVLLDDKVGFVVENGEYIENIVEALHVLCEDNENIQNALSSLITYLEEYNSLN